MAEYTAVAVQTVQVNNNVLFTDTNVDGCDLIYHRDGSGTIRLFSIPGKCSTRFKVTFGGNIAVPATETAAAISLALSVDGEPDNSTIATVTPADVDQYFNVSTSTYIYVRHGCCATIGVRNISTIPINVQNANIIITRE